MGESCNFKHNLNKTSKGGVEGDRPNSLSQGPRSQGKDSKGGKGASEGKTQKVPVRRENQIRLRVTAISRKVHEIVVRLLASSQMYKTKEGCRFGERSVSFFIHMLKDQARRRRTIKHLRKRLLQLNAVIKNWSVSQDVEPPKPKVGLTNENRSILQKNGKRSPRAHLEH